MPLDYKLIVQDLVAPGDDVNSLIRVHVVECTLEDKFRILALVEHAVWNHERIAKNYRSASSTTTSPAGKVKTNETGTTIGNLSPDSREFVILVCDGRPPIRSVADIDLVNLIPISGNSFSCELDMDNGRDESEVCVLIKSGQTPPQFVKLACGNLSQNFIDEVFRAASCASNQESGESFPWLSYYQNLMDKNTSSQPINPFLVNEHHFATISGCEDAPNESEEDEENVVPRGVGSENLPTTITSVAGRELLLRNILDTKKDAYTDLQGYKVYVATWNVNGQSPGSICLREWLVRTPEPPHIYAIGFQELDLSKEAFLFSDSPREKEWLVAVKKSLHPGAKYRKLELIRLVGMMLLVFVRDDLHKSIHHQTVVGEYVGTGLLGKMGNKGGVAVRFDIDETSICIVNCHLAAHVEEYQRRNQDYSQITSRLIFNTKEGPKHIRDHDQIFWFGDMNYRINPTALDPDKAKAMIKNGRYADVLKFDQLRDQMREGKVFHGFTEGPIQFRPTYKYDVNTDNWDSSEKNRSPAWCDRVLWKGDNISQSDYVSVGQYKLSDHKPVASLFEAKIKVLNQPKYRKVYEDALKWLDKEENKCLPQVVVEIPGSNLLPHSNRNEIHFGKVKFLEPLRKSFVVRNVGQYAVRLEFIKKLNDNYVCKDWLQIEPISAFIQPEQCCEVRLEVMVDKRSAASLNIGKDTLYDILVLHLEGGKDIFVTVVGDYERSIFGCSIAALVNMSEPIRNISPGKLIELEKGALPISRYDIPKELWFLVDRLYKTGMDKESLFSQSGLTTEILQIRDWLDEIPNTPLPGKLDSVAEALVILLDSFPEPIIPYAFHLKCMDASSNFMSCKQLLKQLPPAHKNVFLYIITFLRELLLHSDKNGTDAKMLALLFGRVLLHDQNQHGKPKERDERRKEAFIYQFLVNEDSFLEDF